MTKTSSDRKNWCDILTSMALPVLSNMSKGVLHQQMTIEIGPTWDKRDINIGYLECFARLMSGLSPWLSLPDDKSDEGRLRNKLLNLSLDCYKNAVDPSNADYLKWEGHSQVLVECAYIAESFLRAYDSLWIPLDEVTKKRYIDIFISLRKIVPYYSNWLLFSAIIETFLNKSSGSCDMYRIIMAIRKMEEWYVGDGWYSDGPNFAFDYYNSFVIQPMLLECLYELKIDSIDPILLNGIDLNNFILRMQRFCIILERLISPEGTFPVVGRSITYRSAFLQPLAYLSWKEMLPAALNYGQVRSAMTSVLKNMFSGKQNYNNEGFLLLGFNGHQPEISNSYTNTGSLYMASLAFLPLGLPENHSFWISPAEDWTAVKAWGGKPFEMDHAYAERGKSLKTLIKEKIKNKIGLS